MLDSSRSWTTFPSCQSLPVQLYSLLRIVSICSDIWGGVYLLKYSKSSEGGKYKAILTVTYKKVSYLFFNWNMNPNEAVKRGMCSLDKLSQVSLVEVTQLMHVWFLWVSWSCHHFKESHSFPLSHRNHLSSRLNLYIICHILRSINWNPIL